MSDDQEISKIAFVAGCKKIKTKNEIELFDDVCLQILKKWKDLPYLLKDEKNQFKDNVTTFAEKVLNEYVKIQYGIYQDNITTKQLISNSIEIVIKECETQDPKKEIEKIIELIKKNFLNKCYYKMNGDNGVIFRENYNYGRNKTLLIEIEIKILENKKEFVFKYNFCDFEFEKKYNFVFFDIKDFEKKFFDFGMLSSLIDFELKKKKVGDENG